MKIPTIAAANASGGNDCVPAPNPWSSNGLMSAGNSGSVAAAATMPSTARPNIPA
ncbi:hypothetical protein D3C83_196290 [compost metagenome]